MNLAISSIASSSHTPSQSPFPLALPSFAPAQWVKKNLCMEVDKNLNFLIKPPFLDWLTSLSAGAQCILFLYEYPGIDDRTL